MSSLTFIVVVLFIRKPIKIEIAVERLLCDICEFVKHNFFCSSCPLSIDVFGLSKPPRAMMIRVHTMTILSNWGRCKRTKTKQIKAEKCYSSSICGFYTQTHSHHSPTTKYTHRKKKRSSQSYDSRAFFQQVHHIRKSNLQYSTAVINPYKMHVYMM